jgi:hypothetical protein
MADKRMEVVVQALAPEIVKAQVDAIGREHGGAAEIIRNPLTGKVEQVNITLPEAASQQAAEAIAATPGVANVSLGSEKFIWVPVQAALQGITLSENLPAGNNGQMILQGFPTGAMYPRMLANIVCENGVWRVGMAFGYDAPCQLFMDIKCTGARFELPVGLAIAIPGVKTFTFASEHNLSAPPNDMLEVSMAIDGKMYTKDMTASTVLTGSPL